MGYFPFCIDIENKNCLVVGGGVVALRKIEKLIPFGPKIKVVAPEICGDILNLGEVAAEERVFKDSDVDDAFFVISATDDSVLNAHIFDLCQKRNILVNTVDDKEKCGFIFPAIVKTENITVGISTEGRSPIYARFLREKLEESLNKDCDEIIGILNSARPAVKREISDENNRKKAFERLLKLCIEDKENLSEEKISEIIEDLK